MSSSVTTDFREEYEAERERLLRRRFLWYAGVVIGLGILTLMGSAIAIFFSEVVRLQGGLLQALSNIGVQILSLGIYVTGFLHVLRHPIARGALVRLVFWLILLNGAIGLIWSPIASESQFRVQVAAQSTQEIETNPSQTQATTQDGAADVQETSGPNRRTMVAGIMAGNAILQILLTHLLACAFLPLTPRECIKPIVPLYLLNTLITLLYITEAPKVGIAVILLSPLVAAPGMLICWWRLGRFRHRFHFKMLKGRYGEIKQDLDTARQIHEALFPEPLLTGPVRFEYRYQPMRQIGGDYLYARVCEADDGDLPILNLAIVDVTGHGIGAALTVNRLHGEITRQFGEEPDASPGQLLNGLNDYLHHTLSSHSVYATALFMRIDPARGVLSWASAGHPPAFLRAVDGTIDRLDSTTLVLGATRGEDFDATEREVQFMPGDVLIAYTDGAIEARNDQGQMLGLEGLQRMIAGGHPDENGGWASSVLREVDQYRHGPAQDDTLLVEIYRPVHLTTGAALTQEHPEVHTLQP